MAIQPMTQQQQQQLRRRRRRRTTRRMTTSKLVLLLFRCRWLGVRARLPQLRAMLGPSLRGLWRG
jgi:hypothetical protein